LKNPRIKPDAVAVALAVALVAVAEVAVAVAALGFLLRKSAFLLIQVFRVTFS
jgi:hypothetical protein